MKTVGIVAEFNPFHNGHKYLFEEVRANGAEEIVCVMSGNFVQRCEPAFFEKHARARAAIYGGADLIVELPLRFAIGSAEKFATGAIALLKECGVDTVAFGSECGDISKLMNAADALIGINDSAALKTELKKGVSFASARQNILSASDIDLSLPNDILATEYIKASKILGYNFDFFTVKRTDDYLISAKNVRKQVLDSDLSALPPVLADEIEAKNGPATIKRLENIILAFLRNLSAEDVKNIYGINPAEGMDKRILKAAKEPSLEEVYLQIKTKRFTMSAVRRAVWSAYFRIRPSSSLPPYIHTLAANEKGQSILRRIRKSTELPVVANLAKLRNNPACADFVDEERRATDLFNLAIPRIKKGMTEFTDKISF